MVILKAPEAQVHSYLQKLTNVPIFRALLFRINAQWHSDFLSFVYLYIFKSSRLPVFFVIFFFQFWQLGHLVVRNSRLLNCPIKKNGLSLILYTLLSTFPQGAEWILKQRLCTTNDLFLHLPCLAGWLDRDQMEEVCVAGSHLCTHRLPSDRRGPHPLQLQPLPEGRRAKRVAAQPAAGQKGTLALLVGGRPKLCRSHPPWACR